MAASPTLPCSAALFVLVLLAVGGVAGSMPDDARSPQSPASVARWRQGGRGRGEMGFARRQLFPDDEDAGGVEAEGGAGVRNGPFVGGFGVLWCPLIGAVFCA